MKKSLICAAIAIASASAVGFSADTAHEKDHAHDHPTAAEHRDRPQESRAQAERALEGYYGKGAKIQITKEYQSNNVLCYDATVLINGTTADAAVTASGALITAGLPVPTSAMTAAAQQTAELFKSPPQTVIQEETYGFFVSVAGADKRHFVIEYDATGHITDIQSPEQVHEADMAGQRAGVATNHQVVEETVRRFQHDKIDVDSVTAMQGGYFRVGFKNPKGRGMAVINAANDVPEWRVPAERKELPEAVQESIDRDLRGDKVININRGATRVYKMAETVGSHENLTLIVRADGSVERLSAREMRGH